MSQHLKHTCVAILAAVVSLGARGSSSQFPAAPSDPRSVGLKVELTESDSAAGETPAFRITIRNEGPDPVLLNGGSMLGNGKQIWSSMECAFRNSTGQDLPLHLHWRVSAVGGRIYFLGLPLRPGDEHSILVSPRDYYVLVEKPLPIDTYELRCSYRGQQSEFRDRTQLPRCWEGYATAAPVRFDVRGAVPEILPAAEELTGQPAKQRVAPDGRGESRAAAGECGSLACPVRLAVEAGRGYNVITCLPRPGSSASATLKASGFRAHSSNKPICPRKSNCRHSRADLSCVPRGGHGRGGPTRRE